MLTRLRPVAAALAASAALAAAAPAAAQTFDFNAATPGATTPLTQTAGGVSATFSAAPGTGFFYEVSNATRLGVGFSTLTGNFLIQPSGTATPLLAVFSQPLSAISFNFATAGGGAALTLQAYLGATLVGSTTATSTPPSGSFNGEGVATFADGPFDNVRLSVAGTIFAVDDIVVRPSVVPEPGSLALVGAGVTLLGGLAARRRCA